MRPVGIILAAGRGQRLEEISSEIPKGLLEFEGYSLIDRQLDCLIRNGIDDVYVIVGYEHKKVKECIGNKYGDNSKVQYIYNDRWNTANNIYSLFICREIIENGFVLVHCDDLFHYKILTQLLLDPAKDAIVVDDYKKLGEEEMKVKIESGFLKEINKTMEPDVAHGEYIGMAKFSPGGAEKLFSLLEEYINKNKLDGWYDEIVGVLAEKYPIKAVSTGGLPWTEIDTPEDLEKARNEVWPAILNMLEDV